MYLWKESECRAKEARGVKEGNRTEDGAKKVVKGSYFELQGFFTGS